MRQPVERESRRLRAFNRESREQRGEREKKSCSTKKNNSDSTTGAVLNFIYSLLICIIYVRLKGVRKKNMEKDTISFN